MRTVGDVKQAGLNAVLRLVAGHPRARRVVFTAFYRFNIWGSGVSRSGRGSDLEQTLSLRRELPPILQSLKIARLVDAPCGDVVWLRMVELPIREYVGVDIVPELIRTLQSSPPFPGARFEQADVVSDPVPAAETTPTTSRRATSGAVRAHQGSASRRPCVKPVGG